MFGGDVGVREENETLITFAALNVAVIDLAELAGFAPEKEKQEMADPAKQPASGRSSLAIDVPILPNGIEFADADIDLVIKTDQDGSGRYCGCEP